MIRKKMTKVKRAMKVKRKKLKKVRKPIHHRPARRTLVEE
jgi:hypothetical protein